MKKLVVLSLLLWAAATPMSAALSSTTVWEIRTTGLDTNSGGFNSAATGTDRTQSDTPFISFTDLVIDATTNTKITSAANPFDSTSPGNTINVASGTGFTVQTVQIVSVASGVATCDKSVGTLGSTAGVGKLGGAKLTHSNVWALAITGNYVWTKAGTYTITAAFGSGFSINWIGYNTTRGDINGANLARPLITSSTNSVGLYNPSGNPELMKNISMSSTAATRGIWGYANSANGGTLLILNCKIDGLQQGYCGQGGNCGQSAGKAVIAETEILNSTVNGIVYGGQMTVKNSWLHNNGATTNCQIVTAETNAGLNIENSVVSAGTCGINVSSNGSTSITHSDIVNHTLTYGVQISSITSLPNVYIVGNILYGNNTYNVTVNATAPTGSVYIDRNGVGGAGTANYLNVSGTNDVALSADPFTSSTDFSLNGTVGGGVAAKRTGFPGALPGGSGTGHSDLGAVQSVGGGTHAWASAN